MIGEALTQAAHDLLIGLVVVTAFSALCVVALVLGSGLYRRWHRRTLAEFRAHTEAVQREAREATEPLRVIGGGSRGPDQRAAS